MKWVKVFKNGPSKIFGRQRLKKLTWSIFEYPNPNDTTVVTNFFCEKSFIYQFWLFEFGFWENFRVGIESVIMSVKFGNYQIMIALYICNPHGEDELNKFLHGNGLINHRVSIARWSLIFLTVICDVLPCTYLREMLRMKFHAQKPKRFVENQISCEIMFENIKVGLSSSQKVGFIWKMMKNPFYFILKSLLILKTFIFLY